MNKKAKFYNPTTNQWEVVDADNAETLGGNPPEYYATKDEIGILTDLKTSEKANLVGSVNEVFDKTTLLNDRLGSIESEIKDSSYTPTIYNTSSIFTVGQGTDESGNALDYSDSIVDGQVEMEIQGRTVVNLIGDIGNFENSFDTTKVYNGATCEIVSDAAIGNGALKIINTKDWGGYKIDVNTSSNKYYFISVYIKTDGIGYAQFREVNWKFEITTNDTTYSRYGVKTDTPFNSIMLYSINQATVWYDGVMVNEITEEEFNNLTVDELMQKYPYVDGLSGVKTPILITSCRKNLFNETKYFKLILGTNPYFCDSSIENGKLKITALTNDAYTDYVSTGENLPTSKRRLAIKIKPSTTYTYSRYIEGIGGSDSNEYCSFFDENYNFISFTSLRQSVDGRVSNTFTTPNNAKYITFRFGAMHQGKTVYYSKIQLEEGSTATEYEEYKVNKTYILTNLAGQELFAGDRVYSQNGKWYLEKTMTDDGVTELDTPIIKELTDVTPLTAYAGGTITVTSYMRQSFTYNNGITFDNALSYIDKVIDAEGNEMEFTLADDGLSCTITNGVNGEVYTVYGEYQGSALPTVGVKYPMNASAQIQGNTQSIIQLGNTVDEHSLALLTLTLKLLNQD